jgi:hypothetical protein
MAYSIPKLPEGLFYKVDRHLPVDSKGRTVYGIKYIIGLFTKYIYF